MRSLSLTCASALVAAACSSDAGSKTPDASPGSDAGAQASCLVPADYSALGIKIGTADSTTANSLTVTLDPGPPRDVLFLLLTTGKGAFAAGIKTGTYTITGADANRATCGLCVSIIADIVAGQGPSKFYFADSGTVTLTVATPAGSAAPSNIAGSATGLHFVEDDGAGGAVAGGCSSKITSVTFGS